MRGSVPRDRDPRSTWRRSANYGRLRQETARALRSRAAQAVVEYSGKSVRYEDCGTGHLRLATSGTLRSQLEEDYGEMIAASMFVQPSPSFETIAARLADLEERINAFLETAPVTI